MTATSGKLAALADGSGCPVLAWPDCGPQLPRDPGQGAAPVSSSVHQGAITGSGSQGWDENSGLSNRDTAQTTTRQRVKVSSPSCHDQQGYHHSWSHSDTHVCVLSRSVTSDSLQPPGLQPARLLCPCDSPGKNTGVGCHFLLQLTHLHFNIILGSTHSQEHRKK